MMGNQDRDMKCVETYYRAPNAAAARSTSAGGEEKEDGPLLLPTNFEPSKKRKILTSPGDVVTAAATEATAAQRCPNPLQQQLRPGAAAANKKATITKNKATPKKIAAPTKKKTTDSVLPKNLSEILENNVSTFPKGFSATISSEIYDAMFREIFVEYQLCDQATEERPIVHQRLGKGPDGLGCSYILIDWGHIKEVERALGPDAPGCRQFIKHFKRCFLDQNRESGCTVSIGRGCQIRLYDGGATSSRHNDFKRNMVNRYMSSLCVNPNEVRGLNLYANYYVDGKQKNTSDIVGDYEIPSGSSIMISALAAGNAQGRDQPPTTFSSTEYGDETFLMHQSTPCKGRNMCIIIDFDECNETVYRSFLEKNCNPTTFKKGLQLQADVEQALTEEFQRPRSGAVRLAFSEAMVRHHANPNHVFNSMEYREAQGEVASKHWSDQKNREAHGEAITAHWDDPKSAYNSTEHRQKLSELMKATMNEYYSDPKNRQAKSKAVTAHYSNLRRLSNKPKTKQYTRNQWRKFGLLRQPYQCDKCGHQYQGECFRMLQHKENCNHTTILFTSAQLKLQELPGNLPQTVKDDSESKKNEEDRTHERLLRFSNDCKRFNWLLQNHPYYRSERKQGMNILQKNKFRQQIDDVISEERREKEEERQRIQDKDNKGWIKTPLQEGVFDDVDMDGNVNYTMGPYKYNLEWYDFQKKCDQDQSYKYPPFATNYEKNWKPRKEGYLIRQKKRDDELFKKYGTKVIRTTE